MKARKLDDNVWEMPRQNGPSQAFIRLTRRPDLPSPTRFEPTQKQPGDIVL
jgi:hypothetical protein